MPAAKKKTESPKKIELAPVEEEEAKPEIPAHPALSKPTLQIPLGRTALVEHDAVLQRIARVLANGTQYSGHPQINFPVHDGLMIQMQTAYQQYLKNQEGAQERFLEALGKYLEQAQGHLPAAMQYTRADEHIEHIKDLVDRLEGEGHPEAFTQVACYLLTRAQPLARF